MVRNLIKSNSVYKKNLDLRRSFSGLMVMVACVIVFGCGGPGSQSENDFILKTTGITIDRSSFAEELDLKLSAYPYEFKSRPFEYNQLVIELVRSLSEESILLTAADQMGHTITDLELETSVEKFRSDYPEDSFEQILMKNAISYPFWLQRFKKQMIIDRLIDRELRDKIEISAEEMVAFYQNYQAALTRSQDGDDNGETSVIQKIENEKELISRLKMQKIEEKYGPWLKGLEKKYPVEINNEQIKTFLIKSDTDEGKKNDK